MIFGDSAKNHPAPAITGFRYQTTGDMPPSTLMAVPVM